MIRRPTLLLFLLLLYQPNKLLKRSTHRSPPALSPLMLHPLLHFAVRPRSLNVVGRAFVLMSRARCKYKGLSPKCTLGSLLGMLHLTPRNKPIFLSRMHFLCSKVLTPSMNTTLATNTRANSSLSNEPKTHSPLLPPPPLPAQQAAQAIHLSISACSSMLHSRARLCSHVPCKIQVQGPYVHSGSLWECCRTYHLETSLSVVFSRSRSRPSRSFLPPRALIHYRYRSYANALSINRRNRFTQIGAPRWRVVLSLSVPIQISRVRNQSRVRHASGKVSHTAL